MPAYKVSVWRWGGDQVGPTISFPDHAEEYVRNFVKGMESSLDEDKVYVVYEEAEE